MNLYILEIEVFDDGNWQVINGDIPAVIADTPELLLQSADRFDISNVSEDLIEKALEEGIERLRICIRKVAEGVDWRTVETVEPGMYENVHVYEYAIKEKE